MTNLAQPLRLKSGTQIKNRIAKAAMNEAMATPDGRIVPGHVKLYEAWSEGGAGSGEACAQPQSALSPLSDGQSIFYVDAKMP